MPDLEELKARLVYARRLNELHARLFRRVKLVGDGVIVVAGALALSGAVNGLGTFAKLAGGITAVIGVMSILLDPGAKALSFELAQRRWESLTTRVAREKPTADALEVLGNELSEIDPPQLDALRVKAYNDYCEEVGTPSEKIRWPASLWLIAPFV